MAGKIKQLIDQIIEQRSKGSEIIRNTTRAKLILKGVNPDKYTTSSADEPEILSRLQQIAADMGIKL